METIAEIKKYFETELRSLYSKEIDEFENQIKPLYKKTFRILGLVWATNFIVINIVLQSAAPPKAVEIIGVMIFGLIPFVALGLFIHGRVAHKKKFDRVVTDYFQFVFTKILPQISFLKEGELNLRPEIIFDKITVEDTLLVNQNGSVFHLDSLIACQLQSYPVDVACVRLYFVTDEDNLTPLIQGILFRLKLESRGTTNHVLKPAAQNTPLAVGKELVNESNDFDGTDDREFARCFSVSSPDLPGFHSIFTPRARAAMEKFADFTKHQTKYSVTSDYLNIAYDTNDLFGRTPNRSSLHDFKIFREYFEFLIYTNQLIPLLNLAPLKK